MQRLSRLICGSATALPAWAAPARPGVDSASSLATPPPSLPESSGRTWASHGFEAPIRPGSSATAGVSSIA